MKYTENQRYRKAKIVPFGDSGDSDCITTYSKRAAEFEEADFDIPLHKAFSEIHALDDFGIVSLFHGSLEFLVEETNLGFSIRAFDMGLPEYTLDKIAFGLRLEDLLQ